MQYIQPKTPIIRHCNEQGEFIWSGPYTKEQAILLQQPSVALRISAVYDVTDLPHDRDLDERCVACGAEWTLSDLVGVKSMQHDSTCFVRLAQTIHDSLVMFEEDHEAVDFASLWNTVPGVRVF